MAADAGMKMHIYSKDPARNFHLRIENLLDGHMYWYQGAACCQTCGEPCTPMVSDDDFNIGNYVYNHPDNGCLWKRLDDALKGQPGLAFLSFHPTEPSTTQCVSTMPGE